MTKEKKLLICVEIAIVVLVLGIVLFIRFSGKSSIKGTKKIYYGGASQRIPDGSSLFYDSDDTVYLVLSDGTRTPIDKHIYDEEKNSITLTKAHMYFPGRRFEAGKLSHFTEVQVDGHGMVTASRDGHTIGLSGGFLYDGLDTYIFLEPVTLKFNGHEMALEPLSYVRATLSQDIMVFSYGDKQFIIETIKTPAYASAGADDYVISLINDELKLNGEQYLLFTNPEIFEQMV